jgi:hypothetical protein
MRINTGADPGLRRLHRSRVLEAVPGEHAIVVIAVVIIVGGYFVPGFTLWSGEYLKERVELLAVVRTIRNPTSKPSQM